MSDRLLPYNSSLALLTDFYQLTMAYGYWKTGVKDQEAVFQLFFRENPFKGGFAVACGLGYVMDFLEHFRYDASDIEFLASLKGVKGDSLFEKKFLGFLSKIRFECDIDAVPEGTMVFPHEPLIRVRGPVLQCQLLETALLNMINFQTLIATKAVRVSLAAKGEPVIEFGMRRAQGIDGSLAASRAAYIGGCEATSNVLAGKTFGIPVKGTHAHSWIMLFDTELEAFEAYAKALPDHCIFLVDTYDTVRGVRNAVEVGKKLRSRGHEMVGIRLDSGDLADLSREARKILDEAGFPEAKIVGSNELDETAIEDLKNKGACIAVWGVGTKLVTGHDQPALGGIYKLTAVRSVSGEWKYKMKLSDDPLKQSIPGIHQVRRFSDGKKYQADMIYDMDTILSDELTFVDLTDPAHFVTPAQTASFRDLLVPVFRKGKKVYTPPDIHTLRQEVRSQLGKWDADILHLRRPAVYTVGLEKSLHEKKSEIIGKLKGARNA
ncbi:MAG TPA: nicotinate phosphoribosyltransferase [bacterium]|nr:nicotinate phosphoribosyltransferase [bacterium]